MINLIDSLRFAVARQTLTEALIDKRDVPDVVFNFRVEEDQLRWDYYNVQGELQTSSLDLPSGGGGGLTREQVEALIEDALSEFSLDDLIQNDLDLSVFWGASISQANPSIESEVFAPPLMTQNIKFSPEWELDYAFCYVADTGGLEASFRVDFIFSNEPDDPNFPTKTVSFTEHVDGSNPPPNWPGVKSGAAKNERLAANNETSDPSYQLNHRSRFKIRLTWLSGAPVTFQENGRGNYPDGRQWVAGTESIIYLIPAIGEKILKDPKDIRDALQSLEGDQRLDGSAIKNIAQDGTEIKEALEDLTGADRLDASAIKNLPSGGGDGPGGASSLEDLEDVAITTNDKADGKVLAYRSASDDYSLADPQSGPPGPRGPAGLSRTQIEAIIAEDRGGGSVQGTDFRIDTTVANFGFGVQRNVFNYTTVTGRASTIIDIAALSPLDFTNDYFIIWAEAWFRTGSPSRISPTKLAKWNAGRTGFFIEDLAIKGSVNLQLQQKINAAIPLGTNKFLIKFDSNPNAYVITIEADTDDDNKPKVTNTRVLTGRFRSTSTNILAYHLETDGTLILAFSDGGKVYFEKRSIGNTSDSVERSQGLTVREVSDTIFSGNKIKKEGDKYYYYGSNSGTPTIYRIATNFTSATTIQKSPLLLPNTAAGSGTYRMTSFSDDEVLIFTNVGTNKELYKFSWQDVATRFVVDSWYANITDYANISQLYTEIADLQQTTVGAMRFGNGDIMYYTGTTSGAFYLLPFTGDIRDVKTRINTDSPAPSGSQIHQLEADTPDDTSEFVFAKEKESSFLNFKITLPKLKQALGSGSGPSPGPSGSSLTTLQEEKLNLLMRKEYTANPDFTFIDYRFGETGDWSMLRSVTAPQGNTDFLELRYSKEWVEERPTIHVRHSGRGDTQFTPGVSTSDFRGWVSSLVTSQTSYGTFTGSNEDTINNAGYRIVRWNQRFLEIYGLTSKWSYPRRIVIGNRVVLLPQDATESTEGDMTFVQFQSTDSFAISLGVNRNWDTYFSASGEVSFNIQETDDDWVFGATSAVRDDIDVTLGSDGEAVGWISAELARLGLSQQGSIRNAGFHKLRAIGLLGFAAGRTQLTFYVDTRDFRLPRAFFINQTLLTVPAADTIRVINAFHHVGSLTIRATTSQTWAERLSISGGDTIKFNVQKSDQTWVSTQDFSFEDTPMTDPDRIEGKFAISRYRPTSGDIVQVRFPETIHLLQTRRELVQLQDTDNAVTRKTIFDLIKNIIQPGHNVSIEAEADRNRLTVSVTQSVLSIIGSYISTIFNSRITKNLRTVKINNYAFWSFDFLQQNPRTSVVSHINPDTNAVTTETASLPSNFTPVDVHGDTLKINPPIAAVPVFQSLTLGGGSWQGQKTLGITDSFRDFHDGFNLRANQGSLGTNGETWRDAGYRKLFIQQHNLELWMDSNHWNYPYKIHINTREVVVPKNLQVHTGRGYTYIVIPRPLDMRNDVMQTFALGRYLNNNVYNSTPSANTTRAGVDLITYFPGTYNADNSFQFKYGVRYKPIERTDQGGATIIVDNPPTHLILEGRSYVLRATGSVDSDGKEWFLTTHDFETNLPVTDSEKEFNLQLEDDTYTEGSSGTSWFRYFNLGSKNTGDVVDFNIEKSEVALGDVEYNGATLSNKGSANTGVYNTNYPNGFYLAEGAGQGTTAVGNLADPTFTGTRTVSEKVYQLYGLHVAAGNEPAYLASFNTATGTFTRIGSADDFDYNETQPRSLVIYDDNDAVMVGNLNPPSFRELDLDTGIAGDILGNNVVDFGVDADNIVGSLYDSTDDVTIFFAADTLKAYTVDDTGQGTQLGPNSVTNFGVSETAPQGATYHDGKVLFYGSDNQAIFELDKATGVATKYRDFFVTNLLASEYVSLASAGDTLYALIEGRGLFTVNEHGQLRRIGRSRFHHFVGIAALEKTIETPYHYPIHSNIHDIKFMGTRVLGVDRDALTAGRQVKSLIRIRGTTLTRFMPHTHTETRLGNFHLTRYLFNMDVEFEDGDKVDLEYTNGGFAISQRLPAVYTPGLNLFTEVESLKILYYGGYTLWYGILKGTTWEMIDTTLVFLPRNEITPRGADHEYHTPGIQLISLSDTKFLLFAQKRTSGYSAWLCTITGDPERGDGYHTAARDLEIEDVSPSDAILLQELPGGKFLLTRKKNNTNIVEGYFYELQSSDTFTRYYLGHLDFFQIVADNQWAMHNKGQIARDKIIYFYKDINNETRSVAVLIDLITREATTVHLGIVPAWHTSTYQSTDIIPITDLSNKFLTVGHAGGGPVKAYEFIVGGL